MCVVCVGGGGGGGGGREGAFLFESPNFCIYISHIFFSH